jgi:hypothetical protein
LAGSWPPLGHLLGEGSCPLIPKGRDAFRLAVQQTAATLYPRMGANPDALDSLFNAKQLAGNDDEDTLKCAPYHRSLGFSPAYLHNGDPSH